MNKAMKKSRSTFSQKKIVLVFNRSYNLVSISRSVHSIAALSKSNLQSVSFACTGRYISTNGYYFRHLDPNVEIDLTDLCGLKLQEYDRLCGVERRYHSSQELARRREMLENNKQEKEDTNEIYE